MPLKKSDADYAPRPYPLSVRLSADSHRHLKVIEAVYKVNATEIIKTLLEDAYKKAKDEYGEEVEEFEAKKYQLPKSGSKVSAKKGKK